ncbi:efflux transporter outer membrane subunit [Mucisphaera sp.]|uniref:efflux transporter outer membrane subunit n=1 Tax=Mucisphaera sp. TaxID=2913024 RepID=UPI003D108E63
MTRLLIILTLTLTLSACTVGPDYERPETTTPDQYRFTIEANPEHNDILWWQQFNDPRLNQLIEEALVNNLDTRIAAQRVEVFAAQLGITRAEAFPQVGYAANAGYDQISTEIGAGKTPGVDRRSAFYNASLQASWEIDLWGRIRRATEAAQADLLAAEENRRAIILSLVASVARTYINLRALDEQLEIARNSLTLRADSLKLFERQQAEGIISKLEVAQLRSEFERTAATIPAIERNIAQLENALSVLLGRQPGPITRGAPLEQLAPPLLPANLPADLLEQRPDLRAAEQNAIAANARIGVAKAAYYPRISLTGALGVASDQLENLPTSGAVLYQIAAGLTGPIFTAGAIEAGVDAAEAEQQIAIQTYFQTLLIALQEAEDALVTHTTTQQEAQSLTRQVAALENYANLASKRYDNGYASYIEVLDAERDLFDARLRLTELNANQLTTIINIYQAFGGSWLQTATKLAEQD